MKRPSSMTPNPAGKPSASSPGGQRDPGEPEQPALEVHMKTRGVSQSKSQGWQWGLGQDLRVSTNRAQEDLLRLIPPSAQQWHLCARSVPFSTQVAMAHPQALPPCSPNCRRWLAPPWRVCWCQCRRRSSFPPGTSGLFQWLPPPSRRLFLTGEQGKKQAELKLRSTAP